MQSQTSLNKQLDRWVNKAERIEVAKNLLDYKQSAGLKFDKKRADLLQKEALNHAKVFLKQFGREPRPLFLKAVDALGDAKSYRFQMKLHSDSATKIVSSKYKIDGRPVNWGSWRQFAGRTDDSKARKELFDDFIDKSRFLAPSIELRFKIYAETLAKYELDPLSYYLELERMNYDGLTSFVDSLGSGLKSAFGQVLGVYSKEILGREAEYYDDYYFFRSRVFRRYGKSFPTRYEPVPKIIRTMREMGLDARKVKVDDANRKGKNASAFCSTIKIPTDVRVCYRKANPLENFSGVFHEFGHGIHGVSIDPNAPFWDKYLIANGVSEIFSIFFERLVHERLYLREELGLADGVVSDLLSRFRFNELFFATFYSANSMMKLRYWHDGLSMEQANDLYSDLTEKYIGIRYPGKYWQLHHVMPRYFLYSPSYLIAAVRAHELAQTLRSKFGERYWKEKQAGKFVWELLHVGQSIEFDSFSKLDASSFVKKLKVSA